MKDIKFYSQNGKNVTCLDDINIGDIAAFAINDKHFGFIQIVEKTQSANVAILLNISKTSPALTQEDLKNVTFLHTPIIINSHSLLVYKNQGDWRIVAHESTFDPSQFYGFAFKFGDDEPYGKIFISGDRSERIYNENEVKSLDWFSPHGDISVRNIAKIFLNLI